MSKQKRLKKELGTGYRFEQRLTAKNLARLMERLEGSNHFRVVAILTAGAVRLEAVVYWDNGKYSLGYDLMVKDTPFSPEWICWPSIPTISKDLKLSESTTRRALKDLRKAGLIQTEQRHRENGGNSSLQYKL